MDFARRMHEIDEKPRAVDRRMGSVVNMGQAIRMLEIGLLVKRMRAKVRHA